MGESSVDAFPGLGLADSEDSGLSTRSGLRTTAMAPLSEGSRSVFAIRLTTIAAYDSAAPAHPDGRQQHPRALL